MLSSDEDDSDADSTEKSEKNKRRFCKGKKHEAEMLNETLIQMPQTLGVAMPVYGQCKEAKLIDRLEASTRREEEKEAERARGGDGRKGNDGQMGEGILDVSRGH